MNVHHPNSLLQRLAKLPAWKTDTGVGHFITGLPVIDDLLNGDGNRAGLARGSVHEILSESGAGENALSFAGLLMRAASNAGGMMVWCDPCRQLYPPALADQQIDLARLVLLRLDRPADEVWAMVECLRCKGVSAVVSAAAKLSPVQARRLQLAAERGGGIGLLLRTAGDASAHYAAATRWLVQPVPGEQSLRRWKVQLIHGHGGRIGKSVLLEVCRGTNLVRAVESMVDRSVSPASA